MFHKILTIESGYNIQIVEKSTLKVSHFKLIQFTNLLFTSGENITSLQYFLSMHLYLIVLRNVMAMNSITKYVSRSLFS